MTVDILVTVSYDGDNPDGFNLESVISFVEIAGWHSQGVTYAHARELKGIRE